MIALGFKADKLSLVLHPHFVAGGRGKPNFTFSVVEHGIVMTC